MAVSDGYYALSEDVNKVKGEDTDTQQGVVLPLLPELELSMDDDELIKLKKDWEKKWKDSPVFREVSKKQEDNEKYWLGRQYADTMMNNGRPLIDNVIFESLETFLPIVTRQNPEPMVQADNTPEGMALSDKVQKMLVYLGDTLRLKLKLKRVARYWALYLLGVVKVGWSLETNDITLVTVRPQKMIFDPEATVDEGEYTGEYLGEYRKESASRLVIRFPKKSSFIKDKVHDNMGTEVQYIEWWTDDYIFWTLDDEVLGKAKNPHWNYETQRSTVDEFGQPVTEDVEGYNHFPVRKKPYVFLSVFNIGKHPFDDTSLISQNLSLQDLVNKRLKQIDRNADGTNGGSVVSGSHFSKEQARSVGEALRNGATVWVPTGDVNAAYRRDVAPPLPNFVYQSLLDYRGELRNIFGTLGSTPAGIKNEQTVRGKIIVKGQDVDRASQIVEYLEQFSDEIYNWFVQLMYVYYDEPHYAAVLGPAKAMEYISLQNSDFNRKISVSVKDGSLIPKDPLTRRNEAVDLATAGLMDPITLFDRLDFPNPKQSAEQLFLWKASPQSLFPNLVPPGLPVQGQPQQQGLPVQQPQQSQSLLADVPTQ